MTGNDFGVSQQPSTAAVEPYKPKKESWKSFLAEVDLQDTANTMADERDWGRFLGEYEKSVVNRKRRFPVAKKAKYKPNHAVAEFGRRLVQQRERAQQVA